MTHTITDTNFNFPGQKSIYKGKVREVYALENDLLVMIATDRLSAFDVVMPRGIPYKGQILNQIATKMMGGYKGYCTQLAYGYPRSKCSNWSCM